MTPTDPRHGTEAGHEQHARDGEESCEPCHTAKLLAARRRTKRKTMGYKYQRPLGDLYWKLQGLYKQGATYDDLTEWSGVVDSQLWRALNGSPETIVYTRTWRRLYDMEPGRIITPIGVTRRIQALMWLGYSAIVIAEEAGCHVDSIRAQRDKPREFVARKLKAGIADAYDRLSMTIPVGATKQHGAGISRTRNLARKNGWVAPMGWDRIDLDTGPVVAESTVDQNDRVDHAVVRRVLDSGQKTRKLTRAEAQEVVAALLARGLTATRIEREYGFKTERYHRVGKVA